MRRHDSDLPASLAVQLDRLADRFEAAWRSGERPRIEDFLADADAPRRELLAELLLLEWELREAAGERPSLAEYRRRFPGEDQLVADVLAAPENSAAGDTPAVSDATWTERGGGREIPCEFGDYALLEVLGHGGMGVVYKARQRSLDRLVAVKLLRSGAAAEAAEVERFRREAEAAARLDHPQIVSIYEVGQHDDEHFFSMEYVAGRSLAALVAEHPLEPRRAAQYLRDVAAAIHYSHQHGILHRDLKPSNVIVDRFDRPRVMDFGLARRIETDARLTATGALLGTPSYMPPEQAAGRELGPTADVYALGAMLYELLTGRPPFQAATALDTLMMVVDRAPIRPRQLNTKVPRDLETICLKCLEKSAGRRYATAEQLAGDLDRFVRGVPITARPVTRLQRFGRWCRRNPALAGLGGLAAAALLVAAGLLVALAVSQSLAARRLAKENQATQAALATATSRGQQLKIAAGRLQDETQRTKGALSNATMIALNHGQRLCEQGDPAAGLLWLANGLQLVPEEDAYQQWALRMEITLQRRAIDPFGDYLHTGFSPIRPPPRLRPIVAPSGQVILTGRNVKTSSRGEARLWDVASGQPLTPLLHHGEALESIALSPDGRTALTAGGGVVRLWDLTTGTPRTPARRSQLRMVHTSTFSTDGGWFVLMGPSGQAERFETAAPSRSLNSFDFSGRDPPLGLIGICPDRRTFLVQSQSQNRVDAATGTRAIVTTLQRRDLVNGEPVGAAIQLDGYRSGVALSRDGGRLLTVGGPTAQNLVGQLWDTEQAKPLGATLQTDGTVHHAAFSPDGDLLLTIAGANRPRSELRLWDADTAQPLGGPLANVAPVMAVGFLPGRDHVWLLTTSGGFLWDVGNGETFAAPVPPVSDLAPPVDVASHPGPAVDRYSEAWVTAMLRYLGRPLLQPGVVESAFFNTEGTRLVTATHRTIRQWNPATREPIGEDVDPQADELWGYGDDGRTLVTRADFLDLLSNAHVTAVAHSRDYSHIAGTVQFDMPSRRLPVLVETASGRVVELSKPAEISLGYWAAFNPAVNRLAGGPCDQPQVWLWDLAGRPIWTDPDLRGTGGVLSPDGRRLAVSFQRLVHLLDAESGEAVCPPLSLVGYVSKMAFSPDGKLLVTGSASAVRVWDAATGRPLGPFLADEVHLRYVGEIAFSPDGDTLLLSYGDPTLRFFPVPGPVAGSPAEVELATEVLTGIELGPDGQPRVLDADTWHHRRRLLEQHLATPAR